VPGVHQQQFEGGLEQIPDGLPVRPANNVAKLALEWEFSVVIPRERLRPADAYDSGAASSRPAPVVRPVAGGAAASGGRHGTA
jgi:hypothetical protein